MVRLIENSYKKQKKFTNNYADIDLELYSNYKHIGQNNNDRDALNNLYLQSDHSYEVGLRLTAPIGKTKINSEKIQLSLQQSNFLAKKRKNLSKIHAYHSQSLKNLQLLRSAQQYQSKNSNDLKKILSLSDKKYKQARIPLRDLIEDQNLYLQSLLRELDIKLAIINQILDYMTVFTTTPFAFTENG
jgi:outer membrane protein TolC